MMSQSEQPSYGRYEGSQAYTPQAYDAPHEQPSQAGVIDDNFVEAVAQRTAQRLSQGSMEKVGAKSKDRLPPDQRTGIAIVSVVALVPLGIVLGQAGFLGLIALGLICLAIFLINAVVNSF